jgi:monofunctional biosynthetic peptidoglycan transglycosylase
VRLVRRLVAVAAATVAALLLWLGFVWPPPSWWRTHWPAETAFMALRARELRGAGHSPPRRYRPVPAEAMSPWLARAAVAAEDDAFYQHHGIDYRSLREALGYRRPSFSWRSARDRAELVRAIGHAWARRDRLRGASTITQQLARNLYLSPSRNPLRKLKEAVIAYRLEWALSKARILELYLNLAELGPNLWGVGAASERYFGQPARDLSLDDAALLVATLPHPLTSNPAFHPGRTIWRQQLIVRKLGGEPVVIPADPEEDTLLLSVPILADSGLSPETIRELDTILGVDTNAYVDTTKDTTRNGRDSIAAHKAPGPDTATVPGKPAPPKRRPGS